MVIKLYNSFPESCGYLPAEDCVNQFIDPSLPMDKRLYSRLVQTGFRRSGPMVYRPHCPNCQACIPVRIPVNSFQPSRSQRRNWRANQDLTVRIRNDAYRQEQFELYRDYLSARHQGSSMENPTRENFRSFLSSGWKGTYFVEFRAGDQLVAVAVTDQLKDGLSAVYTYFAPDQSQRALGKFAILWQIEQCKRLKLDNLYLGYWIQECRKMSYKQDYQPLEVYHQQQWQRLDDSIDISQR